MTNKEKAQAALALSDWFISKKIDQNDAISIMHLLIELMFTEAINMAVGGHEHANTH